jgi:hypothetical protein
MLVLLLRCESPDMAPFCQFAAVQHNARNGGRSGPSVDEPGTESLDTNH